MSLSRVSSLRAAAVLEDCTNRLALLGHAFTVQLSREPGLTEALEKARLIKLKTDCQFASGQVFKLHLELKENKSFSSLQQILEEKEQEKMAEMKRVAKKDALLRQAFHKKQNKEHQHKVKKLEELHLHVIQLKHQLSELPLEDKSKAAERSIELKLQQVQTETGQTEKQLEDQIELLQKQLKEDRQSHATAVQFLQNQHEEEKQKLQQWEKNSKKMLEEKEKQLNNVRCKITLILDRLMEMKTKYREMELVVIEDKEEQEILLQQQAEARAATKLQAWWRGCMVRRGLGSFKNANEAKKGKKMDGKKKKKKK